MLLNIVSAQNSPSMAKDYPARMSVVLRLGNPALK